jgi:hypothetical protein
MRSAEMKFGGRTVQMMSLLRDYLDDKIGDCPGHRAALPLRFFFCCEAGAQQPLFIRGTD